MSSSIHDLLMKGVSNCCSAKVYLPGTCGKCQEPCEAEDEEEEISPKSDALGGSTDLEGALEKILFTPLPTKMVKNIYCGRCDAKKKVPAPTTEALCDCGGKMK